MNANPVQSRSGAHCRTTGEPCKNPPLTGKLRGRTHGGRAVRPPTTSEYTNDAKAATKKRGEMTRMIRDIAGPFDPLNRGSWQEDWTRKNLFTPARRPKQPQS